MPAAPLHLVIAPFHSEKFSPGIDLSESGGYNPPVFLGWLALCCY